MDEQRQWHRWFGLAWTEQMTGQPYKVEIEMDLSLKQQFLDVAILRLVEDRPLTIELPDGFEELRPHNLISFKSFQEAFDLDALEELLGHRLNYRKQAGVKDRWLPREQMRLFAVCVRHPRELEREVKLRGVSDGVYDVPLFGQESARLVVIQQLPLTQRNATLLAFSFREDLARFGCSNYQRRSETISTFLDQLLQRYKVEGFDMPFTVEQWNRENIPRILGTLSEEALMKVVPVERVLKAASVEQRLEGVPIERVLKAASIEQMLAALSPEMREALLRKLQADATETPPS